MKAFEEIISTEISHCEKAAAYEKCLYELIESPIFLKEQDKDFLHMYLYFYSEGRKTSQILLQELSYIKAQFNQDLFNQDGLLNLSQNLSNLCTSGIFQAYIYRVRQLAELENTLQQVLSPRTEDLFKWLNGKGKTALSKETARILRSALRMDKQPFHHGNWQPNILWVQRLPRWQMLLEQTLSFTNWSQKTGSKKQKPLKVFLSIKQTLTFLNQSISTYGKIQSDPRKFFSLGKSLTHQEKVEARVQSSPSRAFKRLSQYLPKMSENRGGRNFPSNFSEDDSPSLILDTTDPTINNFLKQPLIQIDMQISELLVSDEFPNTPFLPEQNLSLKDLSSEEFWKEFSSQDDEALSISKRFQRLHTQLKEADQITKNILEKKFHRYFESRFSKIETLLDKIEKSNFTISEIKKMTQTALYIKTAYLRISSQISSEAQSKMMQRFDNLFQNITLAIEHYVKDLQKNEDLSQDLLDSVKLLKPFVEHIPPKHLEQKTCQEICNEALTKLQAHLSKANLNLEK